MTRIRPPAPVSGYGSPLCSPRSPLPRLGRQSCASMTFPFFPATAGRLLLWHTVLIGLPAGVFFFALIWVAGRLFGRLAEATAAASAVTLALLETSFAALVHCRFYAWLDLFRDHLVLQGIAGGWIVACLLLEAPRAKLAEMALAAAAVRGSAWRASAARRLPNRSPPRRASCVRPSRRTAAWSW